MDPFSQPLPLTVLFSSINLPILLQAVLKHVRASLHEFDSVCMATAMHTMASIRAPFSSYSSLETNPDYLALLDAIGEYVNSGA